MVANSPRRDGPSAAPRVTVLLEGSKLQAQLIDDVRVGLSAQPQKWLPSKWFYDARGSELFDRITELPEYYPTRTEIALLEAHAPDIAALSSARTLVELGPGSGAKTKFVVRELASRATLRRYVPIDVSSDWLDPSFQDQLSDIAVEVTPVVADYESQTGAIGRFEDNTLCMFLGASYGNLFYEQRLNLLSAIASILPPSGQLLLGIDLVKAPSVLVPAYDDSQGVTAAFNLNILSVINESLLSNFDIGLFRHMAIWNDAESCIEMHVQATQAQVVSIPGAGMQLNLQEAETIRTEISIKFTQDQLGAELKSAGFELTNWWSDDQNWYALALASVS